MVLVDKIVIGSGIFISICGNTNQGMLYSLFLACF